ncbi:AvrF1 [Pseudomonas savastanoi pv. glycinea]|uniref:CesT family type III secretion system chaperone n=1 Tax=Pseudomonas quasicaspiana TaxID=2829821 RepID=UPI000EFEAB1C|nr:CesT family type III secretion system chaperone [Pseudomonas quasicaspiana]MCD5981048.1 CesT family type III secretion system chaperone [Pseudomonas quasicaspiana]RMR04894.1 AvrF1 [Pseudomonas savastanoi pv. glycinea]
MTTPHADRLLAALAAQAGSELVFKDGLCALADEQGQELANIEVPAPGDVAFVHARIDLDQTQRGIHERLLQLNFKPDQLGGCWLALDAQNTVRLCAQQDLSVLNELSFSQWIMGFADRLATLRRVLAR